MRDYGTKQNGEKIFQAYDIDTILKKSFQKDILWSERGRRSSEAADFIGIATLDVFRRRDTQHTQQNKKYRCNRVRCGRRRRDERGKEENGFHFGIGVFMLSLERVRMRNNHTVHYM